MRWLALFGVVGMLAGCPDDGTTNTGDMAVRPDLGPDMTVLVPIGGDCMANTDCRAGASPTCLKARSQTSGFCSATCQDDTDCGDNGTCVFTSATSGRCARACESAADCPAGQACWIALNSTAAACFPNNQVNITLNCDPTVADCMVGGKLGGCDRQALGTGMTGECVQRCVVGVLTCPPSGGSAQGCYALDRTKDSMGQSTGDAMKGTFCGYIQVEVQNAGDECLLDGNHYYNVCPQGMQCDIPAFNASGDNRCHILCYLGNFTPDTTGLVLPDGGMVAGACPVGTTCTDVFGNASAAIPVGLCK